MARAGIARTRMSMAGAKVTEPDSVLLGDDRFEHSVGQEFAQDIVGVAFL